jgi:glutaredoxin-related protein
MDQREVVLYTRGRSLRSWRAKRMLRRSGYQFDVVDAAEHPETCARLLEALCYEVALPFVFVDHRPVGGLGVMRALHRSGDLAHLLREEI